MSNVRSRGLWRRVLPVLGAVLTCAALLGGPVAAQSNFTVDVWTNKGGSGTGTSGGSFGVNEELVVYIRASHDCMVSITIGTAGEQPGTRYDAQLRGGETVAMAPTDAAGDLVGTWQVTVDACTTTDCISDSVVFTVGASGQAILPTATITVPAQAATALDALKALKMAQGTLAVDLAYDADGNGSVTADDAQLILKWAVQ
jgi:hypothetical protein